MVDFSGKGKNLSQVSLLFPKGIYVQIENFMETTLSENKKHVCHVTTSPEGKYLGYIHILLSPGKS